MVLACLPACTCCPRARACEQICLRHATHTCARRLGHLLCNVLAPRAVLALTATATPATRACISRLLAIPAAQQLVESPLRDNLRLAVLHANGATRGGGIAAHVVQLLTTGALAPPAAHVLALAARQTALDASTHACARMPVRCVAHSKHTQASWRRAAAWSCMPASRRRLTAWRRSCSAQRWRRAPTMPACTRSSARRSRCARS